MMIKLDGGYLPAYLHLAETQAHKAKFDEALESLGKALRMSKGALYIKGRIAYIHALSGKGDEARKTLKELEQGYKRKQISPITIARIYCGLGENDLALDWLERAYRERDGGITILNGSWQWESLRSSPRFQELLRNIGFEENRRDRSLCPSLIPAQLDYLK